MLSSRSPFPLVGAPAGLEARARSSFTSAMGAMALLWFGTMVFACGAGGAGFFNGVVCCGPRAPSLSLSLSCVETSRRARNQRSVTVTTSRVEIPSNASIFFRA